MMLKDTRLLMGMPITVEICDSPATQDHLERVYAYFEYVDATFSTYKPSSEISRLNRGELREEDSSADMRTVLALCAQTTRDTDGYFDIWRGGIRDPSGVVKGWAVRNAADLLCDEGLGNFLIDAGGDMQVCGLRQGRAWRIGIRNPFERREHVKAVALSDCGIATSGTAVRGQHIYDPHQPDTPLIDIVSLTVIGSDVYEADRLATAAFAMGRRGIRFIQEFPGAEGYMIDRQGIATYTSGFERYVVGA